MSIGDGLVTMIPSSVAYSGTAASIDENGTISMTACTSISVNDCFTSDYENYLVVASGDGTGGNFGIRLRLSGSDATGSDYECQQFLLRGSDNAIIPTRATSDKFFELLSGNDFSFTFTFYRPAYADDTQIRCDSVGSDTANTKRNVCNHGVTTAYDGFTLFENTNTLTGKMRVYAFEE